MIGCDRRGTRLRVLFGAALLLLPVTTALAQTTPTPLASPNSPPATAPDAGSDSGKTDTGTATTAPPVAPVLTPAPPLPNIWLPKPVAELVALDKITARATRLTVRVGQSKNFGSLTVAVRACDVRPPDQPADATAFLDITDSHAGGPPFHGWMIASAPGLSVLQSPTYDIRAAACHE